MIRWIVRLVALVILAGLAAVAYLAHQHQQLTEFADTPFPALREVVVEIAQGSGPLAISQKLFEAGVIADEERFYRTLRFIRRDAGRLRHGEYTFHAGTVSTPNEIIARLLKGEVRNEKITFPEGLRIEEQAAIWGASGLGSVDDFTRLARDATFARSLNVDATTLEGYLFPDTYLVPRSTTTAEMLKLMVERFEKAWAEAEANRLPSVKLGKHQAVTLASIVEKETGQASERPRISCVFHNRLVKDMKLQTDPTVMYAAYLATGRWDENIHKADLERVHPYNTYAVKGLPPGPIANAGARAIEAALHPITCNDLFFVSRNDGTHEFCPDLSCHEANVEKWQRAYFRQKRAEKAVAAGEAPSP